MKFNFDKIVSDDFVNGCESSETSVSLIGVNILSKLSD